tara:strand:- start:2749 stop:3984 length:1236 start_codon:yes stop_codon:yes gene_type:complete
MMKFAHMADCHIGSWKDQKLRDISLKAFSKSIDKCIEQQVDFVLIAGDLFNTSLPAIDRLKQVTIKLKQLKDKEIPVYTIPGSHDFSPSGKTMLSVLEKAGLIINVVNGNVTEDKRLKLRFTIDTKTNAKITGMLGKKGMLEKKYYEQLITENLEQEQGYKIFMFHSAIDELKPKELEKIRTQPLSLLPKSFNYYAAGHVHYIKEFDIDGYGKIVYPGALFPNNFRELEQFSCGGFYIVEYDPETKNTNLKYEQIKIYNHQSIIIESHHLTPEQIKQKLLDEIQNNEFINTIVTLRVKGIIDGKVSDIDWKSIFNQIYQKSAYFVMKSTSMLKTKEFEEIKIDTKTSTEELESNLIRQHIGQIKVENLLPDKEEQLTKDLIKALATEKQEGEKVIDFETRVKSELNKVLNF